MARTDAISMLDGSAGKAQLAEAYGATIERVQKSALSATLSAKRYLGDPTTGSVEIARYKNSKAAAYGTARTNKAGTKVANAAVIVNLAADREIVEEVENKDARLGTVKSVVESRTADHGQTLALELDRAFFAAIEAVSGAEVTLIGTSDEAKLEEVIQKLETTKNDFVDGVDRELISVTMTPAKYGALRTKFDSIIGVNGESITTYHGVRVYSNTRQTKDFIGMVDGSVAQPVVISPYAPRQIELSDAAAICLFFYYGTKVVATDLVAWAGSHSS